LHKKKIGDLKRCKCNYVPHPDHSSESEWVQPETENHYLDVAEFQSTCNTGLVRKRYEERDYCGVKCPDIPSTSLIHEYNPFQTDVFMTFKRRDDNSRRGFKVRIYPTKQQQIQINKTLGCCRKIYNLMLEERIAVYKRLRDNRELLYNYDYTTEKQYKAVFPYLKEVDSTSLQASRDNLKNAYFRFLGSLKNGKKVGFPRFKSKKHDESYTTKNKFNTYKTTRYGSIDIDFEEKRLKLPKLKWVRYRAHNNFSRERTIKKAIVSRTKSGKYFVSLLLEYPKHPKKKKIIHDSKIVAFDMSARDFLVCNAYRLKNPRFYRAVEKTTRKLHKNLSRKQKGSKNREKARLKLARHYERNYNCKRDWTHKITRELVNNYDAIILEGLNIQGMQKFNSGLSKSVTLDFSWNQFTTYLKYKLEWAGKHYIEVDRFFPSSKKCSMCGQINNDLTLADRTWTCSACGKLHDRDKNASVNLKKEGMRILVDEKGIKINHHVYHAVDATVVASGEVVRLDWVYDTLIKRSSEKEEIDSYWSG
jgi:putative transposase